MDFLGDLPFIGPLFRGGVFMVVVRLAGLVCGVALGLAILRRILGGRSSGRPSVRSLAKQGSYEKAGDLCSRRGDHAGALRHYKQGEVWIKAGHAARRTGDSTTAAIYFERGGSHKLALAAQEAALSEINQQPSPANETRTRPSNPDELRPGQPGYPGVSSFGRDSRPSWPAPANLGAERTPEGEARVSSPDRSVSRGSNYPPPPSEDLSLEAPLDSLDAFFDGNSDEPLAQPILATAAPDSSRILSDEEMEKHDLLHAYLEGAPAESSAIKAPREAFSGELPSLNDNSSPFRVPVQRRGKQPSEAPVITFSRAVTERYEIKQSIGRGGMAEVFLAIDRSLQRRVALKFLSPVLVGDERAVEYFRREARSVAALNHPGIVTIYDVGVLDGRPFICMELIDGRDLDARLTEEGPLPLSTAVDMAINICSSLEYAHNRNVIHRDIKPPNIMLLNEGGYKILDFGLAKAIQVERRNQTMVAGTPEYMAPEQLAGAELDGRADLFAFGVTFYESLTNYFPFEGALRTNDIYPPSALVHAIPKELDQIVLRCLALDPSDRFGRAGEVAERLRRIPLVVNR